MEKDYVACIGDEAKWEAPHPRPTAGQEYGEA